MESIPRFKNVDTKKETKEVSFEQLPGRGWVSDWLRERNILKSFTPEQGQTIKHRQNVLSPLAYFIGKDFFIPVVLGLPNKENPSGWQWGKRLTGEKYIQMNAHDLLEKPIDFLRYVTCHEGGHERVSRTEFISMEEWRQPGFAFMMNTIEDPRMNNFVAESYPKYREWMEIAYKEHLGFEQKAEETAKQDLGYHPRHMQAGFEYIKQWFKEAEGKDFDIDENLPEEVKGVVKKTLTLARDSWRTFPTRGMADGREQDELGLSGEKSIVAHARVSYEINRNEIWPEFKKLIEEDMEDQKIQEAIKDMQKGEEREDCDEKGGESGEEQQGGGSEQGSEGSIPQELKDKLTPEEQKGLEEAIEKAVEKAKEKGKEAMEKGKGGGETESTNEESEEDSVGKGGVPIDLDSLSEELKQKIKEYVESLPEDKQKEIAEKAERALKEFDDGLNKELQGKLTENPEQRQERKKLEEEKRADGAGDLSAEGAYSGELPADPLDTEHGREWRDRLRKEVEKDTSVYEKYRREVLPLIDKMESDLRRILIDEESAWKTGYKIGKRIDIQRRIQEKARDVSVISSRAWQKREHPQEKEYAFSLLVDLSGSMREKEGGIRKIDETFKAVIVLAEALKRLGVNTEVIGFNDEIYEYQNFGQSMSREVREKMSGMFKEVEGSCCSGCGNEHSETDLGWATQTAVDRLAEQQSEQKILMVLSDGELSESPKHPQEKFDLEKIKKETIDRTDIVPIDIGTVAGKTVEQIARELKEILEQNAP